MYKTVKTQTNLPVKICHLKVDMISIPHHLNGCYVMIPHPHTLMRYKHFKAGSQRSSPTLPVLSYIPLIVSLVTTNESMK